MIERISYRQLFFLTFMSQMTLVVASLYSVTSYESLHDGWIAALLTGLGGPLITWSIMSLGMRFPKETFVQYAPRVLGKVVGNVVSVIFLLFLMERAAFVLRAFGGMLGSTVYPQTPLIVLIVLSAIIATTGVRYGIEVIGRLADLFTPIFITVTLVVVIASAKNWSIAWLQPVLSQGLLPPLLGAITPIAVFVEQMALLMLIPHLEDARRARTVATWASVAVVAAKLVLVLSVILTFGPFEASRFVLPVYQLARIASFGDFYERLDVIPVFGWSLSMVLQLCVLGYAIVKGVSQLFGRKDHARLVLPIALINVCLSMIVLEGVFQYRAFATPGVTGVYLLVFVFPIVLLMLFVSAVRNIQSTESQQKGDSK